MKEFKLNEYKSMIDFENYEPLTAKQAVCAKCLECCAFDAAEAVKCKCTDCALHQFNIKWMKIPHKEHTMSVELREYYSNKMKEMRKKQKESSQNNI